MGKSGKAASEPDQSFGATVRRLREAKGIGLRQFARTIGLSPTYVSKVERGQLPPPAEDRVIAIAGELGQDSDDLLAKAGRVASDLTEVIKRHPRELASVVRIVGGSSKKTPFPPGQPQRLDDCSILYFASHGEGTELVDRIRESLQAAKKDAELSHLIVIINCCKTDEG